VLWQNICPWCVCVVHCLESASLDRNIHALEGFEPTISVIKRQQTDALESTTAVIGHVSLDERNYHIIN